MSPPQRFYDFVTKWAMLVFELKYAVKEEAKQTQTFENFMMPRFTSMLLKN